MRLTSRVRRIEKAFAPPDPEAIRLTPEDHERIEHLFAHHPSSWRHYAPRIRRNFATHALSRLASRGSPLIVPVAFRNDPSIITRQYAEHAPDLLDRLTITDQFVPSLMLKVHRKGAKGKPLAPRAGQQLAMFDA